MFCGTCTLKKRHHALMWEMDHFDLRKGLQSAAHAHET
jgi:hypothetical protein